MRSAAPHGGDTVTVRVPMRLERRGGRKRMIAPDGASHTPSMPNRDESLVRALVRAHAWRRRIESGRAKSITDLAAQEGVTDAYVCQLLPLTCLAPDIVEAVIDGRPPAGLRLSALIHNVSTAWAEQRQSIFFSVFKSSPEVQDDVSPAMKNPT